MGTVKVSSLGASLLLALLVVLTPALGQNTQKKKLQTEKSQAQARLKRAQAQLNATRSRTDDALSEVADLQNLIDQREALIQTLTGERDSLAARALEQEQSIGIITTDLDELREQYKRLLLFGYRLKKSGGYINFILADEQYNSSLKRYRLLTEYLRLRKKQGDAIMDSKSRLEIEQAQLMTLQLIKDSNLNQLLEQRAEYQQNQLEKRLLVNQLQKQEDKYLKQIKDEQARVAKLNRAITNLIEASVKGTKTTRPGSSKVRSYSLSDDASSSFSSMKKKLPWPIAGSITERFGKRNHPIYKAVIIESKGIKIRGKGGSSVKAIHPGTVSEIISIPGAGYSMIIRHGGYFSVLTNLESISVAAGTSVSTGTVLGTTGGDAEVGLQIWKGSERLNPEHWLKSTP